MYNLARLALETDSTRLVTIFVTQQFNPKVNLPGVDLPHHALTHQSQKKSSRQQLRAVENPVIDTLAAQRRTYSLAAVQGNLALGALASDHQANMAKTIGFLGSRLSAVSIDFCATLA